MTRLHVPLLFVRVFPLRDSVTCHNRYNTPDVKSAGRYSSILWHCNCGIWTGFFNCYYFRQCNWKHLFFSIKLFADKQTLKKSKICILSYGLRPHLYMRSLARNGQQCIPHEPIIL